MVVESAPLFRTRRTRKPRGVLVDDSFSGSLAALMEHTGALDVWPHYSLVTAELVASVHEDPRPH